MKHFALKGDFELKDYFAQKEHFALKEHFGKVKSKYIKSEQVKEAL